MEPSSASALVPPPRGACMQKTKIPAPIHSQPGRTWGWFSSTLGGRVSISVYSATDDFVDIKYVASEQLTPFRVTFIDAPASFQQRTYTWRQLKSIKDTNSLPWVSIVDFNGTLYQWEKVGKRESDRYRMFAFQEFLSECGFMDLESKGCAFTWSDDQEGEELVRKRLDRAVCNIEWRVEFPGAEVFAFSAIGSDHCPLLLILTATPIKKRREFRFEAFWQEHEGCARTIKDAWSATKLAKADLTKRIQAVTASLSIWSRKTFKNSHKQINALQTELQHFFNDPSQTIDIERQQKIMDEIENLWRREEMYWGLRSRINWLRWGDKNTQYFHATTIQRRQQSRVSMLKRIELI